MDDNLLQKDNEKPDVTRASLESQKYIRTFAGDIETLKKGGLPELTPLIKTPDVSQENTSVQPPIVAFSPQDPAFHPTPLLKKEELQPLAPIPVREFIPKLPREIYIPPVQSPHPSPQKTTSPIETYTLDFSNRLKDQKASTATVLAAEADAHATTPSAPTQQHRSTGIYIIAGTVLLIVGGSGLYYAYVAQQARPRPVIIAPTVPSPIYVDDRQQLSGTSTALLQDIKQSLQQPLSTGTVRLLYFPEDSSTTETVFNALQLPAPNILLRNTTTANSIAGIVNVAGTQSPFFILSVSSYSDTFAGMLAWEPTMPRDLSVLFTKVSTPVPALTTSTSTATTSINSDNTIGGFRDVVISNHDARVYTNAQGNESIVYGYWNQNTLIIAYTTAAFTELIQRLAISHL